MKGVGALMSGTLILGLSCAIPAISAAQDAGTTVDTTTTAPTTTTPAATPPPVDPGGFRTQSDPQDKPKPADPGSGNGSRTPAPADAQLKPADAPSAAASAASSNAHKAASASVTMGDFFFSPASVTIAVGDTVTWRNTGQAPHNATADDGSFKTPDLNNGQSASHTFTRAGTFSYICTIHPNMKGTVRVLSSGGGSGGGGSGGAGNGSESSSGSSGSSSSEASAVASPDAAGDANTLPMTGLAAGSLALVGLSLLAAGLLVRRAGEAHRGRARFLSIF